MPRVFVIIATLFAAPALAAEFQPIQSALLEEMVNGKNAYETTKFTKCAALAAATNSILAEAGENWTRDYDLQEMFRSAAYLLNEKGLYNSDTFSQDLYRFQDEYVDHMFMSKQSAGTVFSVIINNDFDFCEAALAE